MSNVVIETITSIEELPPDDGWVYDIEMLEKHRPYFFANGVLVHNSTYFDTKTTTNEEAIAAADKIAEVVNASYPQFMRDTFFCTPGYDNIVKCGREVVSDSGIFVDKKRYILHLIDLDGDPVDKMKIMGLDTKKTTLPTEVSSVLNSFIERYLRDEEWETIAESIVKYKDNLINTDNVMNLGLPKGVKKVEQYTQTYEFDNNTNLPGHIAASIYFNMCLKKYADKETAPISSGTKIKVFYLKKPDGRFKSIAIPADMEQAPTWFLENYKVDIDAHIERLVDNPLQNILTATGLRVPSKQSMHVDSFMVF